MIIDGTAMGWVGVVVVPRHAPEEVRRHAESHAESAMGLCDVIDG